ncbi:PRKC apoptosis WT1 regulator protein isoform X2 [Nycticebus coucang]|uniref:PRKC apoptosis WT1 regulator protein isoform X2 n=1 Tax=Nycticebus coucang TaxID=9470 RepID=UPI00234DF8AB|nr:PRKC apoptosis WT1 regulator protein isoform X2 [Nycticebus coucang]
MATGGYRTGGSTTDFLEEWKAKREKMRAKQNPPGPATAGGGGGGGGGDPAGKPPAGALGTSAAAAANELNNNLPGGAAAPAAPAPGGVNCAVGPAALTRAAPGPRRPEEELPAAASGAQSPRGDEDRDGAPEKGKSSGPSARKGKGQIEKRKLREKRRSTGVVNIPAAECLDEYEDDEAGQKERRREDAITQQNTAQNEAAGSLDPGTACVLQLYMDMKLNSADLVSLRSFLTHLVCYIFCSFSHLFPGLLFIAPIFVFLFVTLVIPSVYFARVFG